MTSLPSESEAKKLWQAHAHVWNIMLSYINSMSLKCAVELGIADIIHSHGKPIPLSVLASQLSISPARTGCFRRLMRLLVHAGLFSQSTSEKEELFGLTSISADFLVKGKAESVFPLLLFALDPAVVTPWHRLSRWLMMDEPTTPFEMAHGKQLFELTGQSAELNSLFNEGMASDARLVAKVITLECGDMFHGLGSLVDVGGGNGAMAMAIAEASPQVKCTVFDLPHVVASLEGNTKVEAIGGDMFEYIPPADAVLLKWVLHDWSDEDCVRILENCKKSIPSKEKGGKVIIIEMIMKLDDYSSHEMAETQLIFDVHMMGPVPGKERSEAEWKNIFTAAGFLDYKIIPILGLRSVIEVYY